MDYFGNIIESLITNYGMYTIWEVILIVALLVFGVFFFFRDEFAIRKNRGTE
jgi:hypothetical protein